MKLAKDEVLKLASKYVISTQANLPMTADEIIMEFANAIADAQREKWTEVKSIFLPPSGRTVFAFDGKRVVRATWVAKFTDDRVSDDGDFYDYRESDDTYWLPEGWYERIDHWGDYDMVHINSTVTHWMPLPALPDAIRANK